MMMFEVGRQVFNDDGKPGLSVAKDLGHLVNLKLKWKMMEFIAKQKV